jgi:N-methylhydantoinase B
MDGCTMKVLYTAEGARGSDRDGRARALKRELDGSETVLPGCYGVTLKPGERVIFYSSGGGGYGSPLDRDPGRVPHDLREG